MGKQHSYAAIGRMGLRVAQLGEKGSNTTQDHAFNGENVYAL